jgi:cell wall-associated NlpC family hydrolase
VKLSYRLLLLVLFAPLTAPAVDLSPFVKEGDAFHREIARRVGPATDRSPESLALLLERIRNAVLSDRVAFIANFRLGVDGGRLVLEGDSERAEFRDIVLGVLGVLGYGDVEDRVSLLPDLAADPDPFGVVVRPHLLTWSTPELTGFPMDESLLGEPVYLLKELPGSWLIRNFSGYWGYADKAALQRVSRATFLGLVNGPKALLLEDTPHAGGTAPAGAKLTIRAWGEGDEAELDLPGVGAVRVGKTRLRRIEREADVAAALARARAYLGVPYNLGGRNREAGIDCSGLVQMAYRGLGLNLARDAKQQYLAGNLIHPCVSEALLPGDALFFMNRTTGQVDHTGLYLGDRRFIHATGPRVREQSMDPAAPDYFKRFDQDYIGAKRVFW